jgi:hypothetical protein
LLFINSLFDASFGNSPLNIETVSASSGYYFEPINNLHMSNHHWNIITYFDLAQFQNEVTTVKRSISNISKLCIDIKKETTLDGCSDLSLSLITSLQNDIKTLELRKIMRNRKTKRSTIRNLFVAGVFVESVNFAYNTFFSNDNSDYKSHIKELIELNENKNVIFDKQTLILQSVIASQLNDSEQVLQYIQQLRNNTYDLKKQLFDIRNELFKKVELLKFNNAVQEKLFSLSYIVENIVKINDIVLDFLISPQKKSPNLFKIIPTVKLISQLTVIEDQLSRFNLSFPIHFTNETIHMLFKMATIEATFIEQKMIISMSIPVIRITVFQLYKIHILPRKIANTDSLYSFLIPKSEYIATEPNWEEFVYLSEKEIANCKTNPSISLVCETQNPILLSTHADSCEMNILKNHEISKYCETRVSRINQELWIKLEEKDSWLFTSPAESFIFGRCMNSSNVPYKIIDSGILRIAEGCTAQSKIAIIQSTKIFATEWHNISLFNLSFSAPLFDIKFPKIDQLELDDINISLPKMITTENKETLLKLSKSLSDVQHEYYSSNLSNKMKLVLFIAFFLITFVLYKIFIRCLAGILIDVNCCSCRN